MKNQLRPALPRLLCGALVAILFATAPCGARSASAETKPTPAAAQTPQGSSATPAAAEGLSRKQVAAIEKGIQGLRELKLKHPVPIVTRTPEQATKILEAEIDRQYTPEQIDTDGRAGAMLGLYPHGINLKASSLGLLESQVVAFYDFHSKQMVIVKGALTTEFPGQSPQLREKIARMILAHEFTHALQDQNFHFGAEEKKLEDNSDRSLALHSVAEGDATISGYAFMLGGMNSSLLHVLLHNLENISKTFTSTAAGVPRGVAEPLIFQYTDGVRFVARAYQRGGWKAVDKLYTNPPESTQQIMHPSLYYAHPELPDRVTVAGYKPLLRGWHVADSDTLGALGLRIILQNTRGKNSPDLKLAEKWAGDRLVMLRKGKSVGVIWMVAFRDAGAAKKFGAIYRKVLARLSARRAAYHLEVRRSAVLVVVGNPASRFDTLVPALWKASKITAPPPGIPPAAKQLQAALPHTPRLANGCMAAIC
jgi:hypothetical protein